MSINLFIAQLPPGEDPFDVARRDPALLQALIDNARPAGEWVKDYLVEHPEADLAVPIPAWMESTQEALVGLPPH